MKIASRSACRTLRVLLALGFGAAATLVAAPVGVAIADTPPVIVKMRDMPPSFDPSVVTINVGDTVKWENIGNSVHHATDDHDMAIKSDDVQTPKGAPIFDSGFMRPGETFTHTFTTPGVYKYVCVAHEASGMIGEVIVKPRNG
jgi:plastocyanin